MAKAIIMTGATGNLGGAVTRKLLADGYTIYMTLTPQEQTPAQAGVHSQVVDLSNESACAAYVREVFDKEKEIAAGILLVGGFQMGGLTETDCSSLDKMFKLNFYTAFAMAKPLFEQLSARGGGQIILIGARPALKAAEGQHAVAYAMSKSLIFQLAELINVAGKDKKVHATVIVPSTIDTPANRKSMPDADPARWVPASGIADTIAYLLTDSGSMMREAVIKMYNGA